MTSHELRQTIESLIAKAEARIRSNAPPLTAEKLIAEGRAATVTVADLRAALRADR